jgi:hypothetical protein
MACYGQAGMDLYFDLTCIGADEDISQHLAGDQLVIGAA